MLMRNFSRRAGFQLFFKHNDVIKFGFGVEGSTAVERIQFLLFWGLGPSVVGWCHCGPEKSPPHLCFRAVGTDRVSLPLSGGFE
jgi:hypothetical protein